MEYDPDEKVVDWRRRMVLRENGNWMGEHYVPVEVVEMVLEKVRRELDEPRNTLRPQ